MSLPDTRDWTHCDSGEFPQKEVAHCSSCHDEWDAYDNGVIDHDHRMETDMKDGRLLVYCCSAYAWFEDKEMVDAR